jgi:2C-methyl-D-erythritol 2,4-cyclodiphosphate synthase
MKFRVQLLLIPLLLTACASNKLAITDGGSQVQIRQIQTREYDTLDKRDTLRSIIATLQDLGFVIDKADFDLAAITATKLQDYQIRMTVTVREREGKRLAVRANARFNENLIEDPVAYQDFFAALDKAMFLTLHNVD